MNQNPDGSSNAKLGVAHSTGLALPSQLNWLEYDKGKPLQGMGEFELYSDAHITGEFRTGLGPYCFLNTVPMPGPAGSVSAPVVLRLENYLPEYKPDFSKTDESLFHGGTMMDELAALVSLSIGARMKAGGILRRFESDKDPLGQPTSWDRRFQPAIPVRQSRIILPDVLKTHSLEQLELLKSIPKISPAKYVALVRACSSYQNALWFAESEPLFSWLMLVTALETAANEVYVADFTPTQRLHESKPELAEILEQAGGTILVDKVAASIAHTLGATKKFLDFTLHFMPSEPPERPNETYLRIEWSRKHLKAILGKVYGYRSRFLHGGIGFPAPMCKAPLSIQSNSKPSEKPIIGLASHSCGGTWLPEDAPINLNTFHFIVRGALLNWWRSLVRNDSPSSEGSPN